MVTGVEAPAVSAAAARERGGWLGPLAVALIWGVNVPVMKAALVGLHPFAFNALRLTLSVGVLGVAARLERRDDLGPVPWRAVVGLAVLTSVVYQALFIRGIERTSASHTGFLIATGPLWTAVIAVAMRVERPSARAWGGLGLAFVGTALVVATAGGGEATLTGNLLVLAAMLAWAWGTVASRAVLERISATRLAFYCSAVALPAHWALAAPHLEPVRDAGIGAWAAVAYSGALSTGVAYVLWNASVRRSGPARTSAYTNLVPLVALAIAWAALGERPSALQLLGGALVLIGISSWRARRPPRASGAGR